MNFIRTRETYDDHLHKLSQDVLLLGRMVDAAIRSAMAAVQSANRQAARDVISEDQIINAKRFAIENECVALIATQQPAGKDVRFLTAILEIITELERIGDYAKGIGKIIIQMPESSQTTQVTDKLFTVADRSLSMLEGSLNAFITLDTETALQTPILDEEVDAVNNDIAAHLTACVIQDPTLIQNANYLMWAAHNLERLADRVTNICERIVYVTTGQITEMDQIDE